MSSVGEINARIGLDLSSLQSGMGKAISMFKDVEKQSKVSGKNVGLGFSKELEKNLNFSGALTKINTFFKDVEKMSKKSNFTMPNMTLSPPSPVYTGEAVVAYKQFQESLGRGIGEATPTLNSGLLMLSGSTGNNLGENFSTGFSNGLDFSGALKASNIFFKDLESIGKRGTLMISTPLALLYKKSVTEAINAGEARAKYEQVFGESTGAIDSWVQAQSKMFDKNERDLQNHLANIKGIAAGIGLEDKMGTDMAKEITNMAYDLAAFGNTTIEQAVESLQDGILLGMPQRLKNAYGIVLTDAQIKEFGITKGLIKEKQQLTSNQEIMLRYMATREAMASQGSTGQHTREMEGPANQLKEMLKDIRDLGIEVGTILMPYVQKGIAKIREMIGKFKELSPEIKEEMVKIGTRAIVLFPLLTVFAKIRGAVTGTMLKFMILKTLLSTFNMSGAIAGFGATAGAAMFLVGALGIFIGTLAIAEDTSITSTERIGDHFSALGYRALGVLQFIGGILMSIVTLIIGGVSIMIEKKMSKIKGFLNGAKKLSDRLGFDWLSEQLGSGVNDLDEGIDKLAGVRKEIAEFTTGILDSAMFKMDSPVDYVIYNRILNENPNALNEARQYYKDVGGYSDAEIAKLEKEGKLRDYLLQQRAKEQKIAKENVGYGTEEWKDLQKEMQEGLEIDPDIFKDVNVDMGDIEKTMNSTVKATDKVKEAINELTDAFTQNRDALRDQIGMFDGFKYRATSSYMLIRNSRQRAKAMEDREQILSSLAGRGINSDVMNQLYSTGMDQLGNLKGLSKMSDERLAEWVSNQIRANATAEAQAKIQTQNNYITVSSDKANAEEVAKEIYTMLRRKGIAI